MAQSFLFHATLYLTGEPYGIIFIHPFDNTFDKRTKRTVYERFRDTDNFHIIFLEHTFIYDGFFLVSSKPREFPYQYHIKGMRGLFCHCNHFLKLWTFLGVTAGNTLAENKFFTGYEIVLLCVFQQQSFLSIRRQFCLILRGNTDI